MEKRTDMREDVHAFIHSAAEAFELESPVYEFGFRPVLDPAEAGGLRDCFPETGYVGCDLRDGAQIDWTENLVALPFPDGAAKTVVCVNTLEYVFEPQRAVREMIRILAPGGVLVICAAADSPPAHYPTDYWRLTPRAVQRLLGEMASTLVGWQGANEFPHTVYGMGCKPPVSGPFIRGPGRFLNSFGRQLGELAGRVSWKQKLNRRLFGWTQSPRSRRRQDEYYNTHFVLDLPIGQQLKHELLYTCFPDDMTGARLDLDS